MTFCAALLARRVIGRPGGLASGILLALPLIVPLLAAVAFETAALPEVGILEPAGRALTKGSGLLHLLLVADPDSGVVMPYALNGTAGSWLVGVGVAVSSFMLIRRLVGAVMVKMLANRCRPLPATVEARLSPTVARLAAASGLKRAPGLLYLPDGVPGAFAVGARRGRILLSEQLLSVLDPAELEATLAHEIAHLEARDTHLLFSAGLLRDLVAWNPIAHLSYRRLVTDREFEADRRAAQITGEPLAVASSLLKVCETVRGARFRHRALVGFWKPGSRISRRVSRLLALADGTSVAARPDHLPYLAAAALLVILGLQAGSRIAGGDSRAWAIAWGTPTGSVSDAHDFRQAYRDSKAQLAQGPAKKGSDDFRPARYGDLARAGALRAKDVGRWLEGMSAWTESQSEARVRLRWESRQDWRAFPMFSELSGPFDMFDIYTIERQPL